MRFASGVDGTEIGVAGLPADAPVVIRMELEADDVPVSAEERARMNITVEPQFWSADGDAEVGQRSGIDLLARCRRNSGGAGRAG